jgi:hypothetical protein
MTTFGRIESDCGSKKAYPSLRDAEKKALGFFRIFGTLSRAYECPWCGKWHLTNSRRFQMVTKGKR